MEKNCSGNCDDCKFCSRFEKAIERQDRRDYKKAIRISIVMMIIFGVATLLSVLLMISVVVLVLFHIGFFTSAI